MAGCDNCAFFWFFDTAPEKKRDIIRLLKGHCHTFSGKRPKFSPYYAMCTHLLEIQTCDYVGKHEETAQKPLFFVITNSDAKAMPKSR